MTEKKRGSLLILITWLKVFPSPYFFRSFFFSVCYQAKKSILFTATKIPFMYSFSGNCAAIHASVSGLYIPRVSTYFLQQNKADRSWKYINLFFFFYYSPQAQQTFLNIMTRIFITTQSFFFNFIHGTIHNQNWFEGTVSPCPAGQGNIVTLIKKNETPWWCKVV